MGNQSRDVIISKEESAVKSLWNGQQKVKEGEEANDEHGKYENDQFIDDIFFPKIKYRLHNYHFQGLRSIFEHTSSQFNAI